MPGPVFSTYARGAALSSRKQLLAHNLFNTCVACHEPSPCQAKGPCPKGGATKCARSSVVFAESLRVGTAALEASCSTEAPSGSGHTTLAFGGSPRAKRLRALAPPLVLRPQGAKSPRGTAFCTPALHVPHRVHHQRPRCSSSRCEGCWVLLPTITRISRGL